MLFRSVVLETWGAALARADAGFRAALEGGRTLQADEKFAQLARGFWTQGVHLHVPAGVAIERPILVRWAVGAARRALIGRTLFRLDEGASASVVEELVPSAPGAQPAQALFALSSEVILGKDSNFAFASVQDLADSVIAFQHRQEIGRAHV